MTSIKYLIGDATSPEVKGPKIICHICNDIGGWGRGFVVALSKRWKTPEKDYRDWYRSNSDFKLGNIRVIEVEEQLFVANMIGQHGIKRVKGDVPIRYEAVEECLGKLATIAAEKGASIHMPRIGCGLAGGKWGVIEPIIVRTLLEQNLNVYVYDFE